MIKLNKNIILIVLLLIIITLSYILFSDDSDEYIKDYTIKIEKLEKKVDSLYRKNDLLELEADSLEGALVIYDQKIKKLNTRIYVIKKQTQEQLDAVDLFGDDELEQFFAKRYGQQPDSIN